MYIFRNNTFLFFKIENWNFQHLFEKEFRETSQFSTHSNNFYFHFLAFAVPIFSEGFAFNLLKVIDIAGQGLDLKFSWTAIMSLSFWPILTSRWIFHNNCGTLMKHQILSCKQFEFLFSILNCFLLPLDSRYTKLLMSEN